MTNTEPGKGNATGRSGNDGAAHTENADQDSTSNNNANAAHANKSSDKDPSSDSDPDPIHSADHSAGRQANLSALNEDIAHPFDQTNGIVEGLEGDADGTLQGELGNSDEDSDEDSNEPAFTVPSPRSAIRNEQV